MRQVRSIVHSVLSSCMQMVFVVRAAQDSSRQGPRTKKSEKLCLTAYELLIRPVRSKIWEHGEILYYMVSFSITTDLISNLFR